MWWPLYLVGLTTGVILVYSYVQWTRRKMYAMLASMSSPKALPVIGHAHKFYNVTPEAIADTLQYFGSFPSPVCIHMGPLPHVAILDPESLQVVLNSQDCLQKPHQYSFFWVPRTLLCAPVHMWKGQRKALNPAFSSAIIGKIVPVFNKKCMILMNILEQYVGKAQRDLSADILKCTLDQIYETSFECEFDMQRSPDGDESVDIFESFMKLVSERFFTVWKYPDFIYRWTKAYRKQLTCMDTYYNKILEKVARHIDIDKRIKEVDEVGNSTKNHSFLHCLSKYLHSQGPIPREDILAHFCLIVFAGNESTAKTVSTALLMLAMHPEIQERCYQEIKTVCPGENQFISAGEAANLTYLEMVIKETMRLFPMVPILGRIATSDVKLSDRHTIPVNTRIVIGTFVIHRDPKIWGPNADQFDPDNFLPDNVAKRHPYSFIPFSGGPRNCPGVRYAWLSMKILLAYILRQYSLSTTLKFDQLKVAYGVLISLTNGYPVSIERRK